LVNPIEVSFLNAFTTSLKASMDGIGEMYSRFAFWEIAVLVKSVMMKAPKKGREKR